jgi:hypothetical protein
MKENKNIVEKLHDYIRQMLMACQTFSPKPSEYAIFYHPDGTQNEWFILIFFPDALQLNEAIKNGVCYQIHQYIWNNLNQMDDFENLNKTIFFEAGIFPKEEKQIDKLYLGVLKKFTIMRNERNFKNPKICSLCCHSIGGHQMIGFPDEETGIASEGWVMCSEKNCNCFRTCSIDITES